MQEVLTAVTAAIAPEALAGEAALALALVPVQYLADKGWDTLKCFAGKILPHHPEEAFYDAFLQTLRDHEERYDPVAGRTAKTLIRELKQDKTKFYRCIHSLEVPQAMAISPAPFPAQLFAERLIEEYGLKLSEEKRKLLHAVIRDCMDGYRQTLYRTMNEKGLLLEVLRVLMDQQDRAVMFETMLSDTATRSDLILLKDALLTAVRREEQPEWCGKTLAEYDQMIRSQFCYIEFTAGFSPRINARDIRMKMSDVFVNLDCARQDGTDLNGRRDFDLASAVFRSRFNVFLGDPGCGKTTLLKKIAFDLSSPENRSQGALSGFIPLYFRLADYSRFYQTSRKGIAEYLQQTFFQHKEALFGVARRERSLVFLMDGLDEIADTPLRVRVVEEVNRFVFANPQYIYFITSRIVGYHDAALHGIFSTCRLEPLSDEKINEFVFQWHMAVEENTDDGKSEEEKREAARKAAQSLIDAIEKNSSVKRLATNPLLLTIITLIHLQGGRLPNKRVELYDICAETFLQHWINRRVESAEAILDREILIELLSRVAFYIHENYANGLIPEDDFQRQFLTYYQELFDGREYSLLKLRKECRQFIDFIRQETGIFAEKGQDENGKNLFGFLHLTFEEYFAAIEFKRRIVQSGLLLKDYISSARWREIILLCAALFGGQSGTGRFDASQFVKKILNTKELFPPMHQNLGLALRIMADDVRLLPDCEKNVWSLLEDVLREDAEMRLGKELEAMMSSVEYKDRLRQRAEQWLREGGMRCVNTVRWLLYCEDGSWDDLLLLVPDLPDFPSFLERFASIRGWPYFKRDPELVQKWANGITGYLNEHKVDCEARWSILMQLAEFISVLNCKQEIPLTQMEDRLGLEAYSFGQALPLKFHYRLGGKDLQKENMQEISKISSLVNYTPKLIVRHEIVDTKGQLSQTRLGFFTLEGNQHYFVMALISQEEAFYEYVVWDALFKEIQIGTYTEPLTKEEFIEIFRVQINHQMEGENIWLENFLDINYSSRKSNLLRAWERGWFGSWDPLALIGGSFLKEDAAFAADVREWARLHGQDAPVHALLAQMVLNRCEPEKNHVTRKALQAAISCYMEGRIPEEQRQDAYHIIAQAVQVQAPAVRRAKLSGKR